MSDHPTEFHYLRIEVTVAAAIIAPDERIVGDNLADVTFAFGWRTDDPGERSDAEINGALAHHISPVVAVIRSVLAQQGWIDMGQTDEPMSQAATPTGEHGESTPVRVFVMPKDAPPNA